MSGRNTLTPLSAIMPADAGLSDAVTGFWTRALGTTLLRHNLAEECPASPGGCMGDPDGRQGTEQQKELNG